MPLTRDMTRFVQSVIRWATYQGRGTEVLGQGGLTAVLALPGDAVADFGRQSRRVEA
jgi:hypothetical protein